MGSFFIVIFPPIADMKQVVIGFGLIILALLVLFQLAQYSYFRFNYGAEIWIGVFSIAFLAIGIFLSKRLFKTKPHIIEKQIVVDNFTLDEKQLEKSGISKRELEILQLINEGLSNQQIAGKLFVSENTVKKHISNLFLKLDVERRTEAVKKAKEMRILG
jgi:DNA-binding CsgD family transcriptional regulator